MEKAQVDRVIRSIWRIEAAKLIGGLTRILRDSSLAEDLAQDAFAIALERWPDSGIPDKPGAWLMAAARRRAIDHIRHREMVARKYTELESRTPEDQTFVAPDAEAALDDDIRDDVLSLMFIACHPVLVAEARIALTLRLIGGLTTDEIARAFMVPKATMAQRIVRAKQALSDAAPEFEVPRGAERAERLQSVMEVIYLIFNEGYAATSGEEAVRPTLCQEALRLGRRLAILAPESAEAHGLIALMEFQASRLGARCDAEGRTILLPDQDRNLWDRLHIRLASAALHRANRLAASPGPYHCQAVIAAHHAHASSSADTDWQAIESQYRHLLNLTPSPVVRLNHAVAVLMASGAASALEIVDDLLNERALKTYPFLPALRGDLLLRLGRPDEARAEFVRAAALTHNRRKQDFLNDRAAKCGGDAAK